MTGHHLIAERYHHALNTIVEEVKEDYSILAAILCGSLAYDVVWVGSDIDLVLLCSDDRAAKTRSVSLVCEDINIHTLVQPRNEFKQRLDAAVRNSFVHSVYARGKLLFSKDPSITALFAEVQELGEHDLDIQLMSATQDVLATHYKAKKWFNVKDDLEYTARWVLSTAINLASVELILRGELVDREALLRALRINPTLFRLIYTDLFEHKLDRELLRTGISAIDAFLEPKAKRLFRLLLDYLHEAQGEPRSLTLIEHFFERSYGVSSMVLGCEWLADIGVIEKASTTIKLTKSSPISVPELAFFYHRSSSSL